MQVGQAQVTRQERYDRSPEPIILYYSASTGPHGLTDRIDYTVPANRVLNLSTLNLSFYRNVVGTADAPILVLVSIWDDTPALIGQQKYNYVLNTLFEDKGVDAPIDIPLKAGYQIKVTSYDSGAAGSIQYSLNMLGSEYDA